MLETGQEKREEKISFSKKTPRLSRRRTGSGGRGGSGRFAMGCKKITGEGGKIKNPLNPFQGEVFTAGNRDATPKRLMKKKIG